MRGRLDFGVQRRPAPFKQVGWNTGITLHFGVKVRKMTHGESGPLVCHRLHKGQGLGGRRANVVHPTLLETAKGCTLVGGHEPSVASATDRIICVNAW